MASTTIFDESEAEWVKDTCSATLARMSLPELLYKVLILDGSPLQTASNAKMHRSIEERGHLRTDESTQY